MEPGENSWRRGCLSRTVTLLGVLVGAACSSTTSFAVDEQSGSQIALGTYVLRRYNGGTLPAQVRGPSLFPNARRDTVIADTLHVKIPFFERRTTLTHVDSAAPYVRRGMGYFSLSQRGVIYATAGFHILFSPIGTVRNSAPGWVSWSGFGAWELPEMDVFDFERISP